MTISIVETAAAPLVATGFEYINSERCTTSPGALTKTGTSWSWSCVGFDTRTDVVSSGAGPRGISFKCPCTNNFVTVGLQQAGISGSPQASTPSSWDTSSTSDFKDLYDAIITSPSSACTSNACAGNMYLNGFDAAFSCRDGTL
jgi:hypothetical protein